MSGVQFTITTVEFQNGPYQPDTEGGPGGDEAGGPLDPVIDTSDPTTETPGGGGDRGGGWGYPLAKLRLGGSGRAALVLDPADVDLRLALRPSGTAAITAETDLADVSAIEGLYPVVAETTTRTGTINFQLVVTAPAGEQVSADGVTWGATATFDASASMSLIQDPDAADSTDADATPITITRTVQRRSGGAYRDSVITLSADVPTRMINPALSWRTITGTAAAAAGLDQAVLGGANLLWNPVTDPTWPDYTVWVDGGFSPASEDWVNRTVGGASWSNDISENIDPVAAVAGGATASAAFAATTLQTHQVINRPTGTAGAFSCPSGVGGSPVAVPASQVGGTVYIDWSAPSSSTVPIALTDDQRAALSSAGQRVHAAAWGRAEPTLDNSAVTYDVAEPTPPFAADVLAGAGIASMCYDATNIIDAGVGFRPLYRVLDCAVYVVQFAQKAAWP